MGKSSSHMWEAGKPHKLYGESGFLWESHGSHMGESGATFTRFLWESHRSHMGESGEPHLGNQNPHGKVRRATYVIWGSQGATYVESESSWESQESHICHMGKSESHIWWIRILMEVREATWGRIWSTYGESGSSWKSGKPLGGTYGAHMVKQDPHGSQGSHLGAHMEHIWWIRILMEVREATWGHIWSTYGESGSSWKSGKPLGGTYGAHMVNQGPHGKLRGATYKAREPPGKSGSHIWEISHWIQPNIFYCRVWLVAVVDVVAVVLPETRKNKARS
jgi:hypothetical protein